MKVNLKLALVLFCGIAIGATGMKAIFAQTSTPPAYFIAETTVHDQELYRKFLKDEPPHGPYGSHLLVRGGRIIPLKGEPPQRVAIVAFPSVEVARKWFESPAHVESMKLYDQAATGRNFIVEGIAP